MDQALACRLLKASSLAYWIASNSAFSGQDEVDKLRPAIDLDLETCQFALDNIDACFLGETTTGELILSFRGTLPPNTALLGIIEFLTCVYDWVNDAQIELGQNPGFPGFVHAGFVRSLNALQGRIDQFGIRDRVAGGKKLYVTGHSKGGSLAFLAAHRLHQAGIPVSGVYTFAAARPGDQDFANAFNAAIPDCWRFEYQDDLVPHLPPRTAAWLPQLRVIEAARDHFWQKTVDVMLHPILQAGFSRLIDVIDAKKAGITNDSPGTLQFIDWSDPLGIRPDSPALDAERQASLARKIATYHLPEIVNDHSLVGGYRRGVCGS